MMHCRWEGNINPNGWAQGLGKAGEHPFNEWRSTKYRWPYLFVLFTCNIFPYRIYTPDIKNHNQLVRIGIRGLTRGMATLPQGNQELLMIKEKVGRPPGELGVSKSMECDIFSPPVLWHCWLGDRKGSRPVKSWVLVCLWWRFDWSYARLVAPVITATYIVVSCNKHRLTQVHLKKRPLKRQERFICNVSHHLEGPSTADSSLLSPPSVSK